MHVILFSQDFVDEHLFPIFANAQKSPMSNFVYYFAFVQNSSIGIAARVYAFCNFYSYCQSAMSLCTPTESSWILSSLVDRMYYHISVLFKLKLFMA